MTTPHRPQWKQSTTRGENMDTYLQEIQLATFSPEEIMQRLCACQHESSAYLVELERRAHIQAALEQHTMALTGILHQLMLQLAQVQTGTLITADWQAQSEPLVRQAKTLLHQMGSCLLVAGEREMIALLVQMHINELQRLPLSARNARHEQQLRALIEVDDWINAQRAAGKELPFSLEDLAASSQTIETLTQAFQWVIGRLQQRHAETQEEREQTSFWLNIWRLRLLHALLASAGRFEGSEESANHQAL